MVYVTREVRLAGVEVYTDGRIVAVWFGTVEGEEVAWCIQYGLAFLH